MAIGGAYWLELSRPGSSTELSYDTEIRSAECSALEAGSVQASVARCCVDFPSEVLVA